MEALTISAANLDVIEQNLGAVAKELNGVVSNVLDTNNHIDDIEERVDTLNNSIDSLIKEIRETTVITDARQSIMYNNAQIEKKYGYFDIVRRSTLSLIDVSSNSNIDDKAIKDLKNQILLNNPNYWLANSLAALSFWLLDDKENTYKELNNSLRKNEEKTSLFFTLINLKYERVDASIHWLSKYLSLQDPSKLDKDFIIILDLVTTGTFGDEAKMVVLKKIDQWLNDLGSNKEIQDSNKKIWKEFILDNAYTTTTFNKCSSYVKEYNNLIDNISISESYSKVASHIESLLSSNGISKNIDKILHDLVFEYEDEELKYNKENLLNSLIITCNGDRDKATKLYLKENGALDLKTDLVSLFSNIVIYKDLFNISYETEKVIVSYVSKYIRMAYEEINNSMYKDSYNININGYNALSKDGKNIKDINNDLKVYLDNKYDNNDKDLLVVMIIINILGIIGLFLTLNNQVFLIILTIILLVSDIILFRKLFKKNNLRKLLKNKDYNDIYSLLEGTLGELIDASNIINNGNEDYLKLNTLLNTLNVNDYINSNGERNIVIDGR